MKAEFGYNLNLSFGQEELSIYQSALKKIVDEFNPEVEGKEYKRMPKAGFIRSLLTNEEYEHIKALSILLGNR